MDRKLFRLAVRLATADPTRQQLAYDFLPAVGGFAHDPGVDITDAVADGCAALVNLDDTSKSALMILQGHGDTVAVAVAVAMATAPVRKALVGQLAGLGMVSTDEPEALARAVLGLDVDHRELVTDVAASVPGNTETAPIKHRPRKPKPRKPASPAESLTGSAPSGTDSEEHSTLRSLVAGTVEALPPLDAPPPSDAALISLAPPTTAPVDPAAY